MERSIHQNVNHYRLLTIKPPLICLLSEKKRWRIVSSCLNSSCFLPWTKNGTMDLKGTVLDFLNKKNTHTQKKTCIDYEEIRFRKIALWLKRDENPSLYVRKISFRLQRVKIDVEISSGPMPIWLFSIPLKEYKNPKLRSCLASHSQRITTGHINFENEIGNSSNSSF